MAARGSRGSAGGRRGKGCIKGSSRVRHGNKKPAKPAEVRGGLGGVVVAEVPHRQYGFYTGSLRLPG